MSSIAKTKKKVRLSYCIPEGVLIDIRERMVSEGYDLKGKSKWISEAVNELLATDNFSELGLCFLAQKTTTIGRRNFSNAIMLNIRNDL